MARPLGILQKKTLRRHRALLEASAQDPQAEVVELPPVPEESERELVRTVRSTALAALCQCIPCINISSCL